MATCDHPSDLVHLVPYRPPNKTGLKVTSRPPALLGEQHLPVHANSQEKELGDIFYFVTSGPRSPWTAVGGWAFLSILVVALIVIPLFHIDPLPKTERPTMLYLQPLPATAGNAVKLQALKLASATSSKSILMPSPVQKTQEAPPATDTANALAGGVPGGVVGGIPGGVFSQVSGAASMPVLAKAP